MAFFKTQWRPEEVDLWTKEDWLAIILSPLAYIALFIGLALSMLLIPVGFVLLGIGIVLTWLMFRIIGPKLTAVSAEYEKKQKEYLERLQRIVTWED